MEQLQKKKKKEKKNDLKGAKNEENRDWHGNQQGKIFRYLDIGADSKSVLFSEKSTFRGVIGYLGSFIIT